MNAIEALEDQLQNCLHCKYNAIIIEYEQVSDRQKEQLIDYDKANDFILFCKKCEVLKVLPERTV